MSATRILRSGSSVLLLAALFMLEGCCSLSDTFDADASEMNSMPLVSKLYLRIRSLHLFAWLILSLSAWKLCVYYYCVYIVSSSPIVWIHILCSCVLMLVTYVLLAIIFTYMLAELTDSYTCSYDYCCAIWKEAAHRLLLCILCSCALSYAYINIITWNRSYSYLKFVFFYYIVVRCLRITSSPAASRCRATRRPCSPTTTGW
jgi:hypothetical protein